MIYAGNPNGQNQRWSRWIFDVYEVGRQVPKKDVEYNAARWIRLGFGSAGRIRVRLRPTGWRIDCLIEGPPAHDPAYLLSVRQQFQVDFVAKGWGGLSWGTASARVVAGSLQDGTPPKQLIEMPSLLLK